jgi:hypothetical protein
MDETSSRNSFGRLRFQYRYGSKKHGALDSHEMWAIAEVSETEKDKI